MMESAGEKPVFVKFSPPYNPPGARMNHFLEEYCQGKEDKAVYIDVEVDENIDVTKQFNISSIPVLLVLVNGQQKEQ